MGVLAVVNEQLNHSDNVAQELPSAPAKVHCALLDERREASRFERDHDCDFAVIWNYAGEEIVVEVHDESVTGLGILVDDRLDLQLGSQVRVLYAGEHLQGEVRHLTPQADGTNLVGLKCQRKMP